jgi:hypothetical protein
MKLRQASAASTSTSALAAASRAPWTASPGRSNVFDGMHAQYEHSPSHELALYDGHAQAALGQAPAQCSPGEPPPSTITS